MTNDLKTYDLLVIGGGPAEDRALRGRILSVRFSGGSTADRYPGDHSQSSLGADKKSRKVVVCGGFPRPVLSKNTKKERMDDLQPASLVRKSVRTD